MALSPCAAEHLAVLELDNCPLITDASLDHLLQACHNLERIELYDCQLITRAGIRRLRVLYPVVSLRYYRFVPNVRARCSRAERGITSSPPPPVGAVVTLTGETPFAYHATVYELRIALQYHLFAFPANEYNPRA